MATKIHTLVFILMCLVFGVTLSRTIAKVNEARGIDVSDSSRYFADHFNATIECIRRHLIKGNPDTGLPPMDPLRFQEMVRLNIDNKYLLTDLKLYGLVIHGLLSFETTSLNLSHLMALDVGYHFDKVHARMNYEGKINLLSLITVTGAGIIDVELKDITINTVTQYNVIPPLIEDYTFTLSLGKTKFQITGIISESWSRSFSLVVSYVTTVLVNTFQNQISSIISPWIMDFYNLHIGHLPFLDFLAIISDLDCPV